MILGQIGFVPSFFPEGNVLMYTWIVFLHLTGVFVFLLGHGASANVAFKLRGERNPDRIRALLDLSLTSFGGMYVGLLLLLITGIIAGFMGNHWIHGWIWASIVLLIALFVLMYLLGTSYYNKVRHAVGVPIYKRSDQQPLGETKSEPEITALVNTSQPLIVMVVGVVGLLLLLWLMMFKPF